MLVAKGFSCFYLKVMLNLLYQLDGISSHLGNTPLGYPQKGLTNQRRPALNMGVTEYKGESRLKSSIHLSLLPDYVSRGNQLPHTSAIMASPP